MAEVAVVVAIVVALVVIIVVGVATDTEASCTALGSLQDWLWDFRLSDIRGRHANFQNTLQELLS